MALTTSRLDMAAAVKAVARMDTAKAVAMLAREGENYATSRLVDMMRASFPAQWGALALGLSTESRWAGYFDTATLAVARRYAATEVAA